MQIRTGIPNCVTLTLLLESYSALMLMHDFFFQVFACATQQTSSLVLTAPVYLGTGCVMELMIVEMEVMKQLIADLNVVSILIFSLRLSTFLEVLGEENFVMNQDDFSF